MSQFQTDGHDMNEVYEYAGDGGKWFRVDFVKKNGEKRKMICRSGVKKHLRGGKMAYDPTERGLKVVFDAQKRAYRMIPTDPNRVLIVKGRGKILFEGEENNGKVHLQGDGGSS